MPVVDLVSGRISGCKKNSLTWQHELGHIEFASTYWGMLYDYCTGAFIKFIICGLVILQFLDIVLLKLLLLSMVLCIAYFYVYEEIWCWRYAYRNKRGNKKSGRKHNLENKRLG